MATQKDGQGLFAAIRAALGSASGELATIRAKLETLRQRREFLLGSPLPRADVEAAIVARVDRLAADYPRQLSRYLASAGIERTKASKLGRLADHINPLCLRSGTGAINDAAPPILQESALCFAFGDVLKARLAAALQLCELDWPADVGPPAAERERELRELETQISALESEERELVAQLRAALNVDATAEQPDYIGGTPSRRVGRAAL